jgi:hypothetical protein
LAVERLAKDLAAEDIREYAERSGESVPDPREEWESGSDSDSEAYRDAWRAAARQQFVNTAPAILEGRVEAVARALFEQRKAGGELGGVMGRIVGEWGGLAVDERGEWCELAGRLLGIEED